MGLHKNLTEIDIHIPYAFSYANAGARTGATGFVSGDVGKLARQTDNNTLWMLTAITPTWIAIGGSSTDELAKISSADTTASYLENKIVAGSGIVLTKLNTGLNESIEVSCNNSSIIHFGNNSISSTTTTRYLSPGWEDGLSSTSVISYEIPSTGAFRNLFVRQNTPAGNGNAVVYTLLVNSVASALSASLASTATSGSDVVNSVSVNAGDYIDLQITKAVSISSSPSNVMASIEFYKV